jgi:hypothetical protein
MIMIGLFWVIAEEQKACRVTWTGVSTVPERVIVRPEDDALWHTDCR